MKNNLVLPIVLSAVFLTGSFCHAQKDGEPITFGTYRTIHSTILNETRQLYVYLPEDYEQSTESYPVVFQLYAHFQTSYYLPAIRTVNQMSKHGLAPQIIVVGVKNQEFRYRDLLPEDHWGGKSQIDRFLKFFADELIPFVEEEYRTKPFRILSGPQAGAAFGIYLLAKKPHLFNAFFLTNPFWITSSRQTLKNTFLPTLTQRDYSNKFMMISYQEDEDEEAVSTLKDFEQILQDNQTQGIRFFLNAQKLDRDFSVPMGFEKGMRKLFEGYKFPREGEAKPLEVITDYYSKLSNRYGFEIRIPLHPLTFEGDAFMTEHNFEKALEIYARLYELYPTSLMALDRLGWVHKEMGDTTKAIQYYSEFLKLQPENPRILGFIEELRN